MFVARVGPRKSDEVDGIDETFIAAIRALDTATPALTFYRVR